MTGFTKATLSAEVGKPGLDALRLAAMVLVTLQHASSITDHDAWTMLGSVNVGQLGVAIFLAISAWLAHSKARAPWEWLLRRLVRIYPAYWITLLASFALVRFVDYKPFTAYQFISQMLGTGLFTHPGRLVNIPTWFVSLLIVCYLILFAGKLLGRPGLFSGLLAAGTVAWILRTEQPWPWMHLLTFSLTSAVRSRSNSSQDGTLLAAGAASLLLAGVSGAFAYTGLAICLLWLSVRVRIMPRCVRTLSALSYEYYLLHGICLAGAVHLLPSHVGVAVVTGILVATAFSPALHRAAQALVLRVGGSQTYVPQGSTS